MSSRLNFYYPFSISSNIEMILPRLPRHRSLTATPHMSLLHRFKNFPSIRVNSRSNFTTSTTIASTQLQTYAAISKTLYKQILKWTKETGEEVPFDPIPPLTLAPPIIDKSSLEQLALIHQKNQENDELKSSGDDDHHDKRRLMNLLPSNTMIESNQIIIPIENASSVHNVTRFVFNLNHHSHHNSSNQEEKDLSIIKDRVSLGFEVLKSLNQLSEMLDERKESRVQHQNRNGVLYHVGQVVQHKTQRWRAIVAGWDKRDSDAIDTLNKRDNNNTDDDDYDLSMSSLTTKEYESESFQSDDEEKDGGNGKEIEYTVYLDEGDAVLTRARVLGSKKVKQHELEPVRDPYLKRIRCSMARYLFDKYDSNKNEFHPGEILTYEYPMDGNSSSSTETSRTSSMKSSIDVDTDHDDHDEILDNDHTAMDSEDIKRSHERGQKSAQVVVDSIQQLSKKWLEDIIVSDPSSISSKNDLALISDIEKDLKDIADRRLLQNASDILTSSTPPTVQKEAVIYLNALLGIVQRVTQVMWHRRTMEKNKDRAEFALGDIVKHKKYNFRGIIAGWDAYPRTDVSRWDGLQHIKGNVNEMPFYHVVADSNDTTQAFGAERRYRYVCQENLEPCPVDQRKDIEVELDDGWSVSNEGTTDIEFIAPDQLKFQHAEKLTDLESDDIIKRCMERLLANVHSSLTSVREKCDDDKKDQMMQLDDLFNLLEISSGFEDAYAIEEFIKEVWKAHETNEVRWALEDGTEALLRGDKVKALNIFDNIINNDDSNYSEAYNKKSTCHYMIGEMGKSIDAAESACEMEPRHFQAFAGLGLVYNDTAQYKKASKCFRRSLKLQPWSPVSSRLTVCLDLMKRLDLQEQDDDSK